MSLVTLFDVSRRLMQIPASPSSVANIIVRDGLGFSVRNAQLLNVAQGAISIAIFASSAWASYKTKQTILVMIVWLLPAIAGSVVLAAIPVTKGNAPGMLIAFYAVQVRLWAPTTSKGFLADRPSLHSLSSLPECVFRLAPVRQCAGLNEHPC